MTLTGKKVALLIAPRGTEEAEFAAPKAALEAAGATVVVVGLKSGEAETVNGDLDPGSTYKVDTTVDDVSADAFAGLVIPGGTVGADKLRGSKEAVKFVHDFFAQQKPVGAICHGPWALIEAGVVRGRRLTSYATLQTDIENAGGNWVDEEVVTDKGLVTSRKPADLPAFCAKLVEELSEGLHSAQARSA